MDAIWLDYWLCGVPGIGSRTISKLTECFGSPAEVFGASEKALGEVLKPAQVAALMESRLPGSDKIRKDYERMLEQGILFLPKGDERYPERLKQIPDAPYGLFVKGAVPEERQLSVAVIGARDCSEYGRYVATELGKYLGRSGVSVISGMARGIDGISQLAALEEGGMSYGVLGCGVDICYPAQNKKLYDRLMENGGILSEYRPGTLPKPQHFPPRNRIVSGLADALVVIEARKKSGTLITVDMALEQGKEVYVVPGRVTDRLSDGCNSLLKQGAEVFLSPEEFVEELRGKVFSCNLLLKMSEQNEKKQMPGNGEWYGKGYDDGYSERMATRIVQRGLNYEVYKALDFCPLSVDEIRKRAKNTDGNINTELMKLCLEGVAEQVMPGWYVKKGITEEYNN